MKNNNTVNMKDNKKFIDNLLAPYQPQLPIEQLVMEVNKLYHAVEASDYDTSHDEIYQQLPSIFEEMVAQAKKHSQTDVWRILDFGCGTGFEAEQLIRLLPQESIAQLTCYDYSPEMLARCRSQIESLIPNASFTSDLKALPAMEEPYNLLITNSLLHHLPDPLSTINQLLPLLSLDALWLAGHEPSSRFYKNAECTKMYEEFWAERKWRKFLSPTRYFDELQRIIGMKSNPAKYAATESFRKGLFKQKPPNLIIDRLVDFHVAHSVEEAANGRGFDFEIMEQDFSTSWQLVWLKTYSFMGSFYEATLPPRWVKASREAAQNFPKDGANFCSLWVRGV